MIDKLNEKIIKCTKCKGDNIIINLPQPGYFSGETLVILQNPGVPATNDIYNKLKMKNEYINFQKNYKNAIQNCYMGKFISMIFDDWEKISITNIVKCPTKNNQMPNDHVIKNCQSYIFEQINILKPKNILCIGSLSKNIIYKFDSSDKYRKYSMPHYSYLYRYNLDINKHIMEVKKWINK